MLKISDAIKDIIKKQPFLIFGLSRKLFNLSNVARLLKPYVEIRTKKEVKETAVLMSLSRLQREMVKNKPKDSYFTINNITVHSRLCTITYFKNESIYNKLSKLYEKSLQNNNYIILNQRPNEITIIMEEGFLSTLKKNIKEKPKHIKRGLYSLGVQFDSEYIKSPGLLHFLIQQISLQNINVWEISSTYTELTFYVEEKDMRMAFEALNNLLEKKEIII